MQVARAAVRRARTSRRFYTIAFFSEALRVESRSASIVKTASSANQIAADPAAPALSAASERAVPGADAATALPTRARGFRLLRYFSIASLIAILLAVVGLGYFFRETAIKQLVKAGEDNNVGLARAFANTLRPQYLPLIEAARKSNTEQVKAHPALAAFHKTVLDAVRQTNVVKM